MTNVPEGKLGLVAVSRDCFPYRHVLIQKRFPHHGVGDIGYNQPKSLPYATENPWA